MQEMKLRDVQVPPLAKTLERGRRLISPKTGIIQKIWQHLIESDDIALFYYFADGAEIGRYGPAKTRTTPRSGHAGSGSLTAERAIAATIGELVERYCPAFYDEQELICASFDELRLPATPPDRFALFAQEQYQQPGFEAVPFTEQTKVNWVQGFSLIRGEPVLVPACFVYLPYNPFPGEARIYQSTSSGLATGNSLEEAILKALYEVVERDAFMIMWYRMISPPHVDLTGMVGGEIQEVLERFAPSRTNVYVCDIMTELNIPVMAVLIVQESGRGGAAAVGAAANLSPAVATRKALEEAALTRLWVKNALKETPTHPYRYDFNQITDFSHHTLLYGDLEMLPHVEFMRIAPHPVPLEAMPDRSTGSVLGDLRTCLHRLGDAGYDVVAVDVTTPDIADVGFRVARVVVPGLQPLDVQYRYRYLGEKRLKEQPENLNPYPHPFP